MRISVWSSDVCSSDLPTVAPADRQVDVARGLGDVGQVVGAVMDQVAEHRPQDLRLRMPAFAEGGELRHRVLRLQDLCHFTGGLPVGGAVPSEEPRGAREGVATFRVRWSPHPETKTKT